MHEHHGWYLRAQGIPTPSQTAACTPCPPGAGCLLPSAAAQAQELGSQVSVDQLNTFQKADIIADVQRRALKALKQELTAADASSALRLVLHDAATYNVATGTGGVDGSIVTS